MATLLKDFVSFLFFSKNRREYIQIAKETDSSAFNVYRLAHGKKASRGKDQIVLDKLRDRKIITRVEIKYS